LNKKVWENGERIGQDKYDKRFARTFGMLNSLDKQGSAANYSKKLADFEEAALGKPHKRGTQELETGVTLTVHIKGGVPYFKFKVNVHVPALRREAFVRRLGMEEHLGGLKYQDSCKKINDDVTEKWKNNN
jgi:hypothetical protein